MNSGRFILHADYAAHLEAALTALAGSVPVFLGNPHWSEADLAEACRQIPRGTETVGGNARAEGMSPCDWPHAWRGRIMIPTGGTGGRIKFAIHDQKTLQAAAHALRDFLVERKLPAKLHCVVLTPPWHVSGLMPAIRAKETGGSYQVLDGRFKATDTLPEVKLPADGTRVASLVPAQLSRLLTHAQGELWLKQFDFVLLGGSSVPPSLLAHIRKLRLPVALSYGMTETAAAIAVCPPEKLWTEDTPRGHSLPGVRLEIHNGRIFVQAPSLCHGYWPASPFSSPYDTGDLGDVDSAGTVRVTGRADRILSTGGEKVDPARVEAVLTAPGLAKAAYVFGLPDETWGRLLVATVIAPASLETALRQAAEKLEPAARPRRYLFVDELPFDARGKIDAEKLGGLWA
jgi:O-succinylbenzoic acid--CoA ligase